MNSTMDGGARVRAVGALLGQLAGDSLGSLVEFATPEAIRAAYPDGVRDLADGGTWNTIAGQPTDDSEMALALARSLVTAGRYDEDLVAQAYADWLATRPFDCGNTVAAGIGGRPDRESQANGALMRISPLGIFGAALPREEVAALARTDAALTHPHAVCLHANALFACAVAEAVRTGCRAAELYERIARWAGEWGAPRELVEVIEISADAPPASFTRHAGWVLIAFGNALYRLRHAASLEEVIVETVMQGGDTDTNAAICGALLGAVHGSEAVPGRWTEALRRCRPEPGPGVVHHRPEIYWPVDAEELAVRLLEAGRRRSQ